MSGFDDIYSTVEQLGEVGKKASKNAVKKGLEFMLDELKSEAPKDSGDSRKHLSIQNIKSNNNGSAWGSCGIGSDNFDKTGSLWFQNYGYDNQGLNFNGQIRIENNLGWMDKIFKANEDKAEEQMNKTLISEIDKVLK